VSRDQLIQQLLVETVHQIIEQGRTTWLLGILEHGFAGYANLGDVELDAAARRLGVTEEEAPVEDPGYADEQDDVAEYTFASRYAGLPGSLIGNWALDSE
jgi:hypothetical protein